jgi:LmbE family N-acetylglucosaminyl deacetylase
MPDSVSIEPLLGRTMIVVAHPDDEAIGCGALLQRMCLPIVAFMTDGAPEDPKFWGKPYRSRSEYAKARRAEAHASMDQLHRYRIEFGDIPDQGSYKNVERAMERLAQWVQKHRPDAVLTHAYEGGHPDHDVCSFISAAVVEQFHLPIWEMPLYQRASGEVVRQQFLQREDSPARAVVTAEPDEVQRKKKMIAVYESQADFIKDFDTDVEQFRPQPVYDFTNAPHSGLLNYEAWGWAMSGNDLCSAFRSVLDQMPRQGKRAA